MAHLFLSPHSDDAALSCGGLIWHLAQQGEPVTAVTVMAGPMPPDMPMTPFVEDHIRRWALGSDPVPGRRAEDERALAELGAVARFGVIPDALYRTDGHGIPLYPDRDALFGAIHPRDPLLADSGAITRQLDPAATIYAPLGAGNHVDHQLARDTVLSWRQSHPEVAVFFYEEYPYSADAADAAQKALARLGHPARPVARHASAAAMRAKIQAIACYRSQISTFWDDAQDMAESARAYALRVGEGRYAERLWQLA